MKKILVILGLLLCNVSYAQFAIGISGGYNTKKEYFGPSIGGEFGWNVEESPFRRSKWLTNFSFLLQGEYFFPVKGKEVTTGSYKEYAYQATYFGWSIRKYFGKGRPSYSGFYLESGLGSLVVNGFDSTFTANGSSLANYRYDYNNYTVYYGFLGTGWDFTVSDAIRIHTALYKRYGNTQVVGNGDGTTETYIDFPSTTSVKLGVTWILGKQGVSEGGGSRRTRSSKSVNRGRSGRKAIKDYSDYKPW